MTQHEEYSVPPGFRVSGGNSTKLAPVLIDPAAPANEGDVITRVGDGYAPQTASGGGSVEQCVDVQLNDTQIRALPSTGLVTLLPIPTAGLRYWPRRLFAHLDTTAGAYTNVAGQVLLMLDAGSGTHRWKVGAFFDSGSPVTDAMFEVADQREGDNSVSLTAGETGAAAVLSAFNTPDGDIDAGDFTGGHADNTLSLRLWYVAAPTGPFGA